MSEILGFFCLCLLVLLGWQSRMVFRLLEREVSERKELLDRVMARSLSEFRTQSVEEKGREYREMGQEDPYEDEGLAS